MQVLKAPVTRPSGSELLAGCILYVLSRDGALLPLAYAPTCCRHAGQGDPSTTFRGFCRLPGLSLQGSKKRISKFLLAFGVASSLVQHGTLRPTNYNTNMRPFSHEELSEGFTHCAPHGHCENGLSCRFGVGTSAL